MFSIVWICRCKNEWWISGTGISFKETPKECCEKDVIKKMAEVLGVSPGDISIKPIENLINSPAHEEGA